MSVPDDQISRLRALDAQEASNAAVEIFGIRVRIGESGALVDGVHQV
jgi:hypothetical protein